MRTKVRTLDPYFLRSRARLRSRAVADFLGDRHFQCKFAYNRKNYPDCKLAMFETQINLTEQNQQTLIEISRFTGKSQQELINLAIEELIKSYQHKKRLNLMQQARGIWELREDLPNLEELRAEFNR